MSVGHRAPRLAGHVEYRLTITNSAAAVPHRQPPGADVDRDAHGLRLADARDQGGPDWDGH